MNPRQFMEILKNLQKSMKCPMCSNEYKIEEIQFLGQIDGLLLLQMRCTKCNLPVGVNYLVSKDPKAKEKLVLNELDIEGKNFEGMEQISVDEVLNFHEYFESFDGNFRAVF